MLLDQVLEFPTWTKKKQGLKPGFIGDIFVGVAGAIIAYIVLKGNLNPSDNDPILIFVAALVGGYSGKRALDAAKQRFINKVETVDLKEALDKKQQVKNIQRLANLQIAEGLQPPQLSELQTNLQAGDKSVNERVFTAAREARRLGARVKSYSDRINRTIPIFKSLAISNPNDDRYQAQLGCALRDALPPQIDEAILKLDRAIELRPLNSDDHWHYELDRVVALIQKSLTEPNVNHQDSLLSQQILDDLKVIDKNHGLGRIAAEFDQGKTVPIGKWLANNQAWLKNNTEGSRLLKKELIEIAEKNNFEDIQLQLASLNTTIRAIQSTYLKKKPIQASGLQADEKVEVALGKIYSVKKYSSEQNGHYQIELDHNAGKWFIWSAHWNLPWKNVVSNPPEQEKTTSPLAPSQVPLLSLQGSVGRGGNNNANDVIKVKQRFKDLGFDWFKAGSNVDSGLIQVIKLFQSIINGKSNVGGDGRIDVDGKTHQWLQAENAPRWIEMPPEGKGFFNREVKIETWDNHDYGTNWLSDTIIAAGKYYEERYIIRSIS